MNYPTIAAFLADPAAPERPSVPPGGPVGPKDDAHMTFLAMTIRETTGLGERVRKLESYARLLASLSPEDPCIRRVEQWRGELEGTAH